LNFERDLKHILDILSYTVDVKKSPVVIWCESESEVWKTGYCAEWKNSNDIVNLSVA